MNGWRHGSGDFGKGLNVVQVSKGKEVVESHDCSPPERTRHIEEGESKTDPTED